MNMKLLSTGKKVFLFVAFVTLLLQVFGAAVSILLSMPAQVAFGGELLDPSEATPALVASRYLSEGTALAPPLVMTVVFALMFLLSLRKDRWAIPGTIVLMLEGAMFVFALMGEYVNPDRFASMPGTLYVFYLFVTQLFSASVFIMGIVSLVSDRLKQSQKTSIVK